MLRAACGKVRRFTLSAAIRKSAPGDGFGKRWNLPRNDAQLSTARPCARDRTEKSLRVRVTWVVEDRVATLLLYHLAGVHHRHAIAELGDHAKVMRDQHDGGAESLTQIAEQFKDLRLNRHIECSGWLIGNEQLWFAGERHGNHHALRHPARDLMWVGVGASTWVWNPNQLEQLNAAHSRRLLIKPLVNA